MTTIAINGTARTFEADPGMPLLWALRDHAGLTGTKYGCGIGACGACTVHLDGQAVRACQIRIGDVGEGRVTTIEGLGDRVGEAVRAAWRRLDVVQCGYCQPGQIMSAAALLATTPNPTDAEIDAALDGNLCRCGTYQRIRAAIHDAARSLA